MAETIPIRGRGRFQDLTGMKFGRLTVLGLANIENHVARWRCLCDCGREKVVRTAPLKSGQIKSCGCLRAETAARNIAAAITATKTHGQSNTKLYGTWRTMLARCLNPGVKSYPHYGGRGIGVCVGLRSFEHFLTVMGKRPSDGHTVERSDNERGYECGCCKDCESRGIDCNVRWATRTEQIRNTRRTKTIAYDGQSKTLMEWSEATGIPYKVLALRDFYRWPPERMLTEPVRGWGPGRPKS